jgi:hypothetical protein
MVTCAKALGLLSAVSGAAGTCSLYLGTFGFEMPGLFTDRPPLTGPLRMLVH